MCTSFRFAGGNTDPDSHHTGNTALTTRVGRGDRSTWGYCVVVCSVIPYAGTEFPDLANPVQMSFDNQGRLWVATMPSYPHYLPGDPRPDDKLLILEDTDNDGKADKQTIWADGLHLPMGFEFAPEGVYLSQGINLILRVWVSAFS